MFDMLALKIIGHMQRIKMDIILHGLRSKEQKKKPMYKIMLTHEEYMFLRAGIIKGDVYRDEIN